MIRPLLWHGSCTRESQDTLGTARTFPLPGSKPNVSARTRHFGEFGTQFQSRGFCRPLQCNGRGACKEDVEMQNLTRVVVVAAAASLMVIGGFESAYGQG
jgi:hypothetical protein